MFYDGPARIENSRFVNFQVDPTPLLTKFDAKYLGDYESTELGGVPNSVVTWDGDLTPRC